MDNQKFLLEIEQQIVVKASISATFEGLIRQLCDVNGLPLKMERFPGGRWYRDLGDDRGHLWGFVQVIKPPQLLEIYGPLFMSYPAAGHLQVRLAETAEGTKVTLRHRALGLIEDQHREGVGKGWQQVLAGIAGKLS
jgi:hypothetical protein